MADSDYLTNQFLVAMPALTDSKFARTVTFIWQHNAEEALGIIINRPLQMKLADVFEQLQMPMSAGVRGSQPVLGPPRRSSRSVMPAGAPGSSRRKWPRMPG